MVKDPATDKYRRTRLFVLTSAQVWAQLHKRAFQRPGGTLRWVGLDNLRERFERTLGQISPAEFGRLRHKGTEAA
jgi:hypothetical protein